MHGRKCLFLIAALFLAGCSSKSLMKPDCHSCTVEEQEWKTFSWSQLEGRWRGYMETFANDRSKEKKQRVEKAVELSFLRAGDFLAKHGVECRSLPAEALVLNGMLWEEGRPSEGREYEAFVPVEDEKVAYGRVSFRKVNGRELCQFRRLGRVMGKNRLNLPTVSFSDRNTDSGRTLASTAPEQEISVEFLRFAPLEKAPVFRKDGRKPASQDDLERPALILRVFQIGTIGRGGRAQWASTKEQFYRLWR